MNSRGCSPASRSTSADRTRSSTRAAIEPADRPGEVVLICAPAGRDAALTAAALRGTCATAIFPTIEALCVDLPDAGAAIIAAEAFDRRALDCVRRALKAQPAWSDIPILVFTTTSATASENRRMLDVLAALDGNVTALERPVHALTMVNTVRAALRGRRRQYVTRQLLDELGAAVRQRDEFLAMLGHELRNPLGAIGNAVTLAARAANPADSQHQRQLSLIQRQVRVLTRLVNDLLDVSRVTSGKIVLQREPIDLTVLLERLVAQAQPTAREQQLHLSMTAVPGRLPVLGDPVRLEQVFTNLIGNALKYTPPRGRIEVSVDRSPTSAIVQVKDSGVGISPEELPHIFELFAQADTTIDRAQGGMGIGLTLVQSLVRLHGGTATAASDGRDKGSVFTITLPLTEAPRGTAPEPRHADGSAEPRHVLLVEDNPDNRASLRELLEFCGHRVTTANNGLDGVGLAIELLPDVALVDIGLPELDGYGVARRIREVLGSGIRLIALTGYGQPEDVRRALDAGFDAHLAKPVDFETLQVIVNDPSKAQLSSILRPRQ